MQLHRLACLASLLALPLLALSAPTPAQPADAELKTTRKYYLKTADATNAPDHFNNLYIETYDTVHGSVSTLVLTANKTNGLIGFLNSSIRMTTLPHSSSFFLPRPSSTFHPRLQTIKHTLSSISCIFLTSIIHLATEPPCPPSLLQILTLQLLKRNGPWRAAHTSKLPPKPISHSLSICTATLHMAGLMSSSPSATLARASSSTKRGCSTIKLHLEDGWVSRRLNHSTCSLSSLRHYPVSSRAPPWSSELAFAESLVEDPCAETR